MKKTYIAPSVQMMDAKIDNHLLAGSPHPDDSVHIEADGESIPVSGSDAGTKHPTDIDYAKKFDSWSAWDE